MATIYAVSSGMPPAAVVVIRFSGEQAFAAIAALRGSVPPLGQLTLSLLCDPRDGTALDRAMIVCFAAPKSYTGEDMAEVHCHGSVAVVASILEALRKVSSLSLRAAAPGEFTRRAVLAGKMDLTRAEGLLDLISAETEAQRRQALAQSEGSLFRLYQSWSQRLFALLAESEARIDFPDEDLPETQDSRLMQLGRAVRKEIEQHLANAQSAERVRCGWSVILLGAPNVGKSSLLNRFAEREAAIVSTRAGTTRDVLQVRLDIEGLPIDMLDTAGLRLPKDTIEAEGVRRARARAQHADRVVFICDARTCLESTESARTLLSSEGGMQPDFLLLNKIDLLKAHVRRALQNPRREQGESYTSFWVSAKTGEGLAAFLKSLVQSCRARVALAPTRARHREALSETSAALARMEDEASGDWALRAQGLREAVAALERLTGKKGVEDLLDRIFAEFCIGK